VYILEEKYYAAITYYLQSKNLPEDKKSHFGETFTLNGLAKAHKALKHYDFAIEVLKESIAISVRYGYRDKTKESYGILYGIYEEQKDYEHALLYYKQFNLYQDSIFSEDKLQFIENLKINYETEQIAAENEILKKDAQLKDASIVQQKSYTLIGIILIVSISGAFIFLYYTYKQNKRRNKFLADYNTNLETQVTERTKELVNSNLELIKQNNQLEQFGYITAHNLRAPVARILGLVNIININAYNPVEDKYILDKLQLTTKELDEIIHDMNAILDIKKGVENSYEIVDFHERIQKIRNILKDNIASTDTIIEEDFSLVKSCFAVPAYIESILYNLISNAIKYRSSKRIPRIKITSGLKNNNLELTVADNGLGIDLKNLRDKVFSLYQRFHIHVEGKGIGLFLVKTQVEAMNGTIEVESKVNEGTTFQILIPLKMVQ
jgi:signal transduction histidine kinase